MRLVIAKRCLDDQLGNRFAVQRGPQGWVRARVTREYPPALWRLDPEANPRHGMRRWQHMDTPVWTPSSRREDQLVADLEGVEHQDRVRGGGEPREVRPDHTIEDVRLQGLQRLRQGVDVNGAKFTQTARPLAQADSGVKRAHGFCPECGTPIFATSVTNREVYGVRVGTVRQRAQLPPQRQAWCRSKLEWASNIEALPQFDKSAG